MAQSRYLTRRTSAEWAAGSIGTPVTTAAYPVLSPSYNVESAEVIPGVPTVGGYIPHFNRPGGRFATCSFVSEMYGQPSNTVPMAYGALMRACGMSEAVASTNFFTYKGPCSGGSGSNPHLLADGAGDLDPVDIIINMDNLGNYCSDAVGNVVFRGAAGQICTASFNFTGRVKTGTSQTASAIVGVAQDAYETPVTPKAVRAAPICTITFTDANNANVMTPVLLSWEYDLGAIVDIRPAVNGEFGYAAPILTGFNPTWSITIEAPAEGTTQHTTGNPMDTWLNTGTFAVAIANTAPATLSKFTWGWTGYLSGAPQLGDSNGKLTWTISGTQSDLTGPLVITTS